MNRVLRHPFVTLGVILMITVATLVAFRLATDTKTEQRKTRLITVGTVSPVKEDLDIRLSFTAEVTPNQVVNLFSRVDGYIAKLHVDKGDFVKRNQLLIEIDHKDYQHAIDQAKANLAAAHAKVAQQ